jgi:multidrug efflux system membrane fusion protein
MQRLFRQSAAASQELERMESEWRVATAELNALEREADAAAVALRQAEDDLSQCRLDAPFPNAVVAGREVETAERVAAGERVLTLLDVSAVKVDFGVPDTLLARLEPGRAVEVLSDAYPAQVFTGRVTRIAPAAEPQTRTFPIEVTLAEPGSLRPGMVVSVRIGQRETVYRLAPAAVQRRSGSAGALVFVAADEGGRTVARQRVVQLDGLSDDRVRVRVGPESALQPGEWVIVEGADRVRDGEPVTVLGTVDALLPQIAVIP